MVVLLRLILIVFSTLRREYFIFTYLNLERGRLTVREHTVENCDCIFFIYFQVYKIVRKILK